uniref:Quinone oxidoreductase n=1 Tax=Stegastes partitus TaxID=144197 RepID=A0A3B4ZKH2_9TELE
MNKGHTTDLLTTLGHALTYLKNENFNPRMLLKNISRYFYFCDFKKKCCKSRLIKLPYLTGMATCQLARSMGLKVLGTAGTPEGMKLIVNNGAHLAFNHREKGYTDKIMAATDGKGVDVIVEMLADSNLSKDLQLVAHGGRIVVSRTTINPDKNFPFCNFSFLFASQEEMKQCAAQLFAGMEAGWLRPVVGPKYPMEKAAQAHKDIIETSGASGKVILTI